MPVVGKKEVAGETVYDWLTEKDLPESIGRLSGFMGNAGVLLRAYVYMRLVGRDGMQRIAEYATLNARITSYNVCYTKLLREGHTES